MFNSAMTKAQLIKGKRALAIRSDRDLLNSWDLEKLWSHCILFPRRKLCQIQLPEGSIYISRCTVDHYPTENHCNFRDFSGTIDLVSLLELLQMF